MEKFEWRLISKGGKSEQESEDPEFLGLVCRDTRTFRHLAKTKLKPLTDVVVEIGCSYGMSTKIIGRVVSPSNVMAIDVSKEAIEHDRKTLPDVRFELLNVLSSPAQFEELVRDFRPPDKSLVLFVDVGGNREVETLIRLLPWLAGFAPRLIVTKSQTMHAEVAAGEGFDWDELRAKGDRRMRDRRAGESNAKKRNWKPHPLKAPMRKVRGRIICRFHNYTEDGCKRYLDPDGRGGACEFDHEHCHWCGKIGHVALACQEHELLS